MSVPLSAQENNPPPPAPPLEVGQKTALDYYKGGGVWMHPLLLCFMGMTAISVYCFITINRKKMLTPNVHQSLIRHMQAREVEPAYQLCLDTDSSYTRVVSSAMLKVNFERDLANKASMEQAAGERLDQEETKTMLWVNYLNVVATIAPMIGLLGTVVGMIQSFDLLAAGKSQPSELAGGIGVAMLTTAGGLISGIPAMFLYFFFRNKLAAITSEIQEKASFLIDILSGEVHLADGNPPPVETETPPAG
jgi:biopolymer transport protein ExbB